MEKPIVSVIIPAYNAGSTIERCIKSLNSQTYPREKFEIIVVDDCSKDNTVTDSKNFGADLVISNKQTSGPGVTRNNGVKKANGSIIAFTDSDCEVKNDWIETLVKEIQNNDVLAGSVINGNKHSKIAWAEFLLEFWSSDENNKRSLGDIFVACNAACKKEVFDKVGGFPNVRAGQDTLFGYAIRRNGFKILFVPKLQVAHLCRTTLEELQKNQRKLGKGRIETTRLDPSIPNRLVTKGRWVVPLIFFGRIIKIGVISVKIKKTRKYLESLPFIFLGTLSYCQGIWNQMKE